MSDMRHVYNAYAAVHNPEVKKSLEESRDAFSKMNLNQLNDQDLYEVSEEILEKVFFHHDLDVPTAESLIEAILSDAIAGDKSPLRLDKIERLTEAFASAFDRVKEKSIRVAKESYTEYLRKKDQLSRLSSNNDLDLPKQRLHQSLVAEDRKTVKSGLLEIIEGKVNAGLQAYLDKKKGKKTDDKEENGNGKSSKGGKPDFLDLDKDGDKKESMKKAAKDKKLKEGMATPESGTGKYYVEGKPTKKQLEVRAQQAKNRAASNKGKMAEETIEEKKGSLKQARKNVGASTCWDGYTAKGTKMKGGKSVPNCVKEEDVTENRRVAHNPEKYKPEDESDKPYRQRSRENRMKDPKRGINSPAFKKFMADRGMSASYEPTLPMLESKKKL